MSTIISPQPQFPQQPQQEEFILLPSSPSNRNPPQTHGTSTTSNPTLNNNTNTNSMAPYNNTTMANNANNPHQQSQQLLQEEINPIILLKQPQLFKETFLKINKAALQFFKNKDLQKGLVLFSKAIDMLDLGKNILKDSVSKYLKLTIFVNLAYGYQNLRKLQKASRFCERAKQQLEKLIMVAKNQDLTIEKYLKLSKFLVTLKFQHCAIVSQLQQHEKALQMCKSTLPELKEQLESMLRYLKQTSSSRLLQKKTGQTVQFSRHVQKFAQGMLGDLLAFLNEPLKKFHFYYWQKNPELNEEQVRKKFIPSNIEARNECKRSILGVSKTSSWMDEFNIGSIMHMNMATVEDFELSLPMEEYYFKDKLYEIVILCSLSYFTMATEIRFLQPAKEKEGSSTSIKQIAAKSSLSQNSSQSQQQDDQIQGQLGMQSTSKSSTHTKSQSPQVILKKYGYQQRSQMNKLSQLYHLRSIEIVSKHIQTVIPYLIHIIKSYDKHYLKKKELQPIAAISEQSQISGLMNESVREYLPEEKIYNDYMKKDLLHNRSRNQEPMDQLLLQSQDNRKSDMVSRNLSEKKSSSDKRHNSNSEELHDVKNVLDFDVNNIIEEENSVNNDQMNNMLLNVNNANNSKFKKNLSKIVEDPKLQSEIFLYSRAQDQQNPSQYHEQHNQQHQNEAISNEYLKSKKTTITNLKSPQKSKNTETKRTKSKSKLNLIKSREKSSTFRKNTDREKEKEREKSSKKNLYTQRSPIQEKRSASKSHYQSNHSNKLALTQGDSDSNKIIKKYHSPELITINESKKRLKPHLTDKSRQKLLKKFIGIPNSQYQQQKQANNTKTKKPKKSDKKPKTSQQEEKKKQSKYYTTFDGQKQYRIKHQSTTHIKVLYKKKNNLHGENQEP